MADQFTYNLKQSLKIFQETWTERDAFRMKHKIEASGNTAQWETVFGAAQARAEELFQPALLDLDNGIPPTLVLEQLLERLEVCRN